MLISKGVTVGEVVSLKLVTGEEIIAKLKDADETSYSLHRPLSLVISGKGLGLQQWLFSFDPDKPVKMSKDKVLAIEATIPELSKQYIAGTSGITLV